MIKPVEPKKILCIHDLSGVGRCSLAVILPVLSVMGLQPVALPTVVLSTHTGGLGTPARLDGCAYGEAALEHYHALGLDFDCIYTGYLGGEAQVALAEKAFALWPSAHKVVDPVMGDNGKAYATVTPELISRIRQLCRSANLILPNYTEAQLLLQRTPVDDPLDDAAAQALADELTALAPSAVVTGLPLGKYIGCAGSGSDRFVVKKLHIDRSFPGTGDLYGAVLIGSLIQGNALSAAADNAAQHFRQFLGQGDGLLAITAAAGRGRTCLEFFRGHTAFVQESFAMQIVFQTGGQRRQGGDRWPEPVDVGGAETFRIKIVGIHKAGKQHAQGKADAEGIGMASLLADEREHLLVDVHGRGRKRDGRGVPGGKFLDIAGSKAVVETGTVFGSGVGQAAVMSEDGIGQKTGQHGAQGGGLPGWRRFPALPEQYGPCCGMIDTWAAFQPALESFCGFSGIVVGTQRRPCPGGSEQGGKVRCQPADVFQMLLQGLPVFFRMAGERMRVQHASLPRVWRNICVFILLYQFICNGCNTNAGENHAGFVMSCFSSVIPDY